MRQTVIALLTLLLVWSIELPAFAQHNKPAEQKATQPAATESDKLKKMIAEARNRGETVVRTCLNDCDEELLPAGFERGRAIRLVIPAYPPIARAARAQGRVEVQVLIDVDGKVIAADTISGHPLLQNTSIKAAQESTFSPAKLDGTPVKVTGVLVYTFTAGQ